MKTRDLISGIFWLGFGAVFTIGGLQQGLVRQGIPGPGSLPFVVGLILIGLSSVILVQTLLAPSSLKMKFFPRDDSFARLMLTLLAIFIYGFFLKPAGFLLTTFVFLVFVLRWVGREGWISTLSFSLSTAVLSYLLFTALQVELPRGTWKF
jgi:putative tricarboxylic transport membrane protein